MLNITEKKMKISSSPAEIVGSMDDLLTEVFLRIPLKPLFRLKLVSKHWNSLISDPKLYSSYNNKNKKPVGFLFENHNPNDDMDEEEALLLSLDRPPSITSLHIPKKKRKDSGYKIFHSCNGLLVGYRHAYTGIRGRRWFYNDYFVYNPTTRKYKTIDNPCLSISLWMYLAFDRYSPHYKIVCVFRPDSPSDENLETGVQEYEFTVYSSKTRSWKKYDHKFRSKFMNFEKGVYWNGSIHWISSSKNEKSIYFTPDDDACGGHSLSFLEMPTPPILGGDKSKNYFGESCDHLNFISYHGRDDECGLKVYEMRSDYSEWLVKYSVDVSYVLNEGLKGFGSFVVCGLVRGKKGGDDKDDSFLVLLVKGKMILYNVISGTFEITSEFDEEKKDQKENNEVYDKFNAFWSRIEHSGFYCPLQYIESLCSV